MKTYLFLLLLIPVALPASLSANSETDHRIENAAKASYNYRTVLQDHVTVKAREGVVTLTGTVQDKDERMLAQDTVENLPGVLRVDNQLKAANSEPEHSDGWIALKIRSTLLMKANVSAADTKVEVKDGAVTLSGTVQNPAQSELTESYARDIDHVTSVKNNLVVAAQPASQSTLSENIDDASITSQVKYALLSHRSTSALRTKVETTDGVVVISGEAASKAEKSFVTKLAEGIRGVRSVSNNMTVKV